MTAVLEALVHNGWPLRISALLSVNGEWGLVLFNPTTGLLDSVLSIQADDDGISRLYFVRNPDKLPANLPWGGASPEL